MECVDFLEFQGEAVRAHSWRNSLVKYSSNTLQTLAFQDLLKKMREVDDKLVYALNCSIPSPSFRGEINPATNCKELYNKLNHSSREKVIRNCIEITSGRVQELRKARDVDSSVSKAFNKELTKLRLLKSELNVEEVVQNRSTKLYYERCRDFFKPPEMNVN